MDYESNMDLVVLKYSESDNLMYKTSIESNFCNDLVNRLSEFHILGIPSFLYTRNFEVVVEYNYTEKYKDELREEKYDFYTITVYDKNASYNEDIEVIITCKTIHLGRRIFLLDDIKSFEVFVNNKDTIKSFNHYYDLKECKRDKDFERVCETICKLIEICVNNKDDIIKYFRTYQKTYASAFDCSLPEFIIDDDDTNEILMHLDPLNKEIRNKLLNDALFK